MTPPIEPPPWLLPLLAIAGHVRAEQLSRFLPPATGGVPAAVLLLFGDDQPEPDLLLIQRAHTLRTHPGQPAFPGGLVEPGDASPMATALREAAEETGLDPSGVQVLATLPALYLPPGEHVVHPVLGWWRRPSPVTAADPAEVASVHRVPLSALLNPANRFQARHPSGYLGPAFGVSGLVVWGFTGGLLSRLFQLAGWEQPWDDRRIIDLPSVVPVPTEQGL
jgi:8-oxo-dGTP pyrophosphatase MutT (NUDIX family)